MSDPFARLGALMVTRRWLVLAVWLVIMTAAGILAPRANSVVQGGGFGVPGSQSGFASEVLQTEFNADTRKTVVAVYRSTGMTIDDPSYRDQVSAADDRLKMVHGVRAVYSFFETGDPLLVSTDRHTTLALINLDGTEGEVQDIVPALRSQLANLSVEHYVTGYAAINYDTFVTSEDDLRRSEFITLPVVLIFLLLVFRTVFAAVVPLVLGAVSVVMALAALFLIGSIRDTSVFSLNVASMIGLGLSIDFSLIIISRYREERSKARDPAEAIARTMATAGRSITYSGITVILSMLVLTFLVSHLMIVSSISLGVVLVACMGVLAGLTLLPAILGLLGDRLEWLRVMPRPAPRRADQVGFWYRFSHSIMARPWIWLILALGALIALASPIRDLSLVGASEGVLPPETESVQGTRALNAAFGANRLTPIEIVMKTGKGGVWDREFLAALQQLSDTVAADSRTQEVQSLVTVAVAMGMPADAFPSITPQVLTTDPRVTQAARRVVNLGGDGNAAVITVVSKFDQYSKQHQSFVYDLRDKIIPQSKAATYTTLVGGEAANFLDFRDALYGRFPLIVIVVTAIIFVILMMFFQSVFLPLKAMFMNLTSIAATYGVLIIVFQYGFGAKLLGFEPLGLLSVVTPAVLYVILFGLSTDYEVFMLSRVKEHYHTSHNNEESVATGLQETAGVITAAGLILIATFGSFATARTLPIKEIGLGLAIGVFLDSTIVRVIMVPATMRLMGNANWWMPAWLKRIVPELREGPSGEAPPATVPAVSNGAAVHPWPLFNVGHLRALSGSLGTDDIVLLKTRPLRIGRDESNDLQFFDDAISRFHARVDFDSIAGTHVVVDLGSTNGVFVNGQRIAAQPASTRLRAGDRIEVGGTHQVVLVYEVRPLAAGREEGRPMSVPV